MVYAGCFIEYLSVIHLISFNLFHLDASTCTNQNPKSTKGTMEYLHNL